MSAMRTLGVPYSDADIRDGVSAAQNQAREIGTKIAADQGPPGLEDKQAVALIAYLDRLGRDLFATPPAKETAAK